MVVKYWVIGTTLLVVVVIVVIAVFVLKRGNSLAPTATATPPLEFNVAPVTRGSGPPAASSSACKLTGYVAVKESQVSGSLELNEGTAVTSVTVNVLSKRSLSPSAYHACASAIPRSVGNPQKLPVVHLPVAGHVGVPGLDHGGDVDLIVRPPTGRAAGAIAYTWEITVNYTSGYGPGSDPQGPFTLLASAS